MAQDQLLAAGWVFMALLSREMHSLSVVMTGHYIEGLMGLLLAVMESLRCVLYVDP